MKLIEAEKAKDVIHEYFKSLMINGASGTDVDRLAVGIGSCLKHDANLLKAIDELPSAEPERPTGEWIQKPRYEDDEYPDAQPNLKCPFCGYEIGWCDMGNYCARCGADLKGGAE